MQAHPRLKVIENDVFKIVFSLVKMTAYSLPMGLFGSFQKKKRVATYPEFESFWVEVKKELLIEKISRVELTHPSDMYRNFVAAEWLSEVGFSIMYSDINHHIPLSSFSLHKMEQRKLSALNEGNFTVEKMDAKDLKLVYAFLKECRAEKGLKVNVSFEKLEQLVKKFPDRYDLFVGKLGKEMASAAITLKCSDEVAYYFLPGTLERYKKASPMVGLLDGIVRFYAKSMKTLDLGVSSIEGKPQEGLIAFKERMGGIKSSKRRYFIKI